jgi:hypothetical protein
MSIVFNYTIDGLDVWIRRVVVVLDQILDQHRALPINCFNIEAEVAINESCGSCHGRCAMNVHFGLSISHQLMKFFATF